jgi:hypothetical protein
MDLGVSVVVQGAERLLEGNLMMGELVDLMKSTIDQYRGTSGRGTTAGHTVAHRRAGCRTHHASWSAFGNKGIWLNNADAPASEPVRAGTCAGGMSEPRLAWRSSIAMC